MRTKVRLADVSFEAGVSLTTASLVLNNRDGGIAPETRRRVLDAVDRLGYHPHASARALATGRTDRIGVVLSDPTSFGSPTSYFSQILSGIIDRAVVHDRNLLLHTARYHDWHAVASSVLAGAADGVVLAGRSANDGLTAALLDVGFPTVCVSYSIDHPRCVSVDCDNEQGAFAATQHLLALGHERLAILYPGEAHSWGAERHVGAARAVAAAGLEESALTVYSWDEPAGTAEWAARLVQRFLGETTRPTGVLCCDEVRAARLLDALHGAGLRVPDDCALISFNSTQISEHSSPPMTSVWQPLTKLGETAVDLLTKLIDGTPLETNSQRFPMRLDVRESCGSQRRQPGSETRSERTGIARRCSAECSLDLDAARS